MEPVWEERGVCEYVIKLYSIQFTILGLDFRRAVG